MSWLTEILKRWKRPEKEPQAEPTKWGRRSYGAASTAIADALTPERLVGILKNAEDGDILAQSELFEAMEVRDAYLDGLLNQRKAGVTSCRYELIPGDDSSQAQAAAEFCQKVVDEVPYWTDRVNDLLDAIPKGFACLEILWETSEKSWRPRDLTFRPQRWWTLDQSDRNKLLLRDDKDWKGREINPLNFIQHVHHARSGSLDRAGLSLACTRPFLVRNYAIKDWLAFAEVFGMPVRLGKLPQGASDADAKLLWEAFKSLGHDAAGMIPAGAEITFPNVNVTTNADFFAKLREGSGQEMTICILGQLLTTGGETGGSYALGQVHQNARWDLVDSDAKRLDETLNRRLFAPISALNFGPDVAPPVYRTTVEAPEDLESGARVVQTLVGSGLKIPQSWVYGKFGIPVPEDDEAVLEPPQAAAPGGGFGMSNAIANAPLDEKKKDSDARWLQRLARSSAYLS
jgi:phage gp29-like protein